MAEESKPAALFKAFELKDGEAHPQAMGKDLPPVVFNESHATGAKLNTAWKDIEKEAANINARIEASAEYAASEAGIKAAENLKVAGAKFETTAAIHYTELEIAKDAVVKKYASALETTPKAEIAALTKAHDTEIALLSKEQEHLAKFRENAKKVAGHEHIGGASTGVLKASEEAAAAVSTTAAKGAKVFTSMKTEAAKLGVIGEKAYKELNPVKKLWANAVANFNVSEIKKTGEIVKAGPLGKGMKVGGAGLGVVIGGYGLKDIGQATGVIGPDTDEQGKEVPADSGKLIKGLGEVGVGAAAMYLTLLKGGKAVGLAK